MTSALINWVRTLPISTWMLIPWLTSDKYVFVIAAAFKADVW